MDASAWYDEGIRRLGVARFPEAREAFERALQLGAGAEARAGLAEAHAELGDAEGAVAELERAVALSPDDPAIALLEATFLPWVYRDRSDIERWRSRYTQRLGRFARDIERYRPNASRILELARTNFLLAYQGRDDVELQRMLGSALSALLRDAWPRGAPRHRAARPRIRVGFASALLYDCTIGRYFTSWIEGLDRAKFEVVGFMLGANQDAYTGRLARSCLSMQSVDLPVLDVAQRIAEAELDILVYPEVGMDPRCRLLSCLRLAPVQLAAWGHPETTGSPEIDAFLSCEEMETAEAAASYTEKLLLLPGLGVRYEAPLSPPAFTREALGIEAGRRAYGCPHSAFKLHPDCDALLAGILANDPEGVVVLFHGQNAAPEPSRQVVERLALALTARGIPARGQLRVLPQMTPTDFRRTLLALDVVVDPPHWSGGNTALDALAMGVPVVTMPGELMRSRQAAAMLRRLDAAEAIAESVEAGAASAVALAGDPARRSALGKRIVANAPRLFGDGEPVARLGELLGDLAPGVQ